MRKLHILFWLCLVFSQYQIFAQTDSLNTQPKEASEPLLPDSLLVNIQDTTKPVQKDSVVVQGDIETSIEYYAEDSIVTIISENKIYLYGNAKVDYGDISLTASQIEINQETSEVTARGVPDSTGRLRGTPVFQSRGRKL